MEPLWTPKHTSNTNIEKLKAQANSRYGLSLDTYSDLYNWSVSHIADFWAAVWDFVGIVHSEPYTQVVDESASIDEVPEWFVGARLNFAENLLRFTEDKPALISIVEGEEWGRVSFPQLKDDVARLAAALRRAGLQKNDRVCAFLPNTIASVVAMLATTSIGAIYSTTAPDFGSEAVLERFSQIKPKFLITTNATKYKQKVFPCLDKVESIAKGLPDLQATIVLPFMRDYETDLSHIPNSVLYDDFITQHVGEEIPPLEFEQLPFNHPVYILYTSGTTGKPKCLVHSAGGTLIQHLKEHIFHGDLSAKDTIFFYTTTGWMMFHWLISAIGVGATVLLYEGSPFHPSPDVLWDMADKYEMTIFGTSAKYIAALESVGFKPRETHNLSTVRAIMSTGSPLKPESFDYVYKHIKEDVMLSSISGGTDIVSCFAGGNPVCPVYRGEIQSRNLGMKVESFDENGQTVKGEQGELVCTAPFPSMPIYFWGDSMAKDKYMASYFGRFPKTWAHGDYLCISPSTGGLVMFGRSDATLNPNGIRFGSAEIYNVVERYAEVADSLVVGQPVGEDERVILFLKVKDANLSQGEGWNDLVNRIKTTIRSSLSPRHVPAVFLPIQDIPYTLNGKKVEIAVKKLLVGQEVLNRSSLANPESLDLYAALAASTLKV